MSSLDPRIKEALLTAYEKRIREGEALSSERRKSSFDTFRAKFGPDRLRSLDGPELLQTMHTHGNVDSLVYWIEYKNDDEFAGQYFGGISGGSAHVYGIFRRRGTQQWVKGSPRNEENITEAEAIAIARKHRDQILAGATLLEALPTQAGDAEYKTLQEKLKLQMPDLWSRAWIHKYFFLLFPDKLDDFHNERWQRYHIMKMLQKPPAEEGLYVVGGCFVRLANELGWTVDDLTGTLNYLNGKPKPYWRVGTKLGGKDSIWAEMKTGNYIAVGWDEMGDLAGFTDNRDWKDKKAALIQLQEQHYPNEPKNVVSRSAGELLNFVSGMAEGEIVIAGDGETVLGIGRITGPYYYENTAPVRAPHRRPVEWLTFDSWHQPVKDGPRTTFWELKKTLNHLEIEKRIVGVPPVVSQPILRVDPGPGVKPRLEGVPARIQKILERKGQAIVYGPPGTGKTYWARQTAYDLASIETYGRLFKDLSTSERTTVEGTDTDPGLVRCCTFHPAYGYEDFLEGYRPQLGASEQLVFQGRDGIFKRICNDARKAPESQKFILLIDEINRGDIPRIFGELLTLLELDKRGISTCLPMSGAQFSVPKNVYVIGTMNTADRSIALLDTALRRRFGFVELMPEYKVLGNVVVTGGIPLAKWLKALNDRIREHLGRDARNLQVGHAYLLGNDGKTVSEMEKFVRILAEDIIPLLEEYCYEDYSVLTRILGEQLVDDEQQCIREKLFDPDRRDELVKALLYQTPDLVTDFEATSVDESVEESEEDEDTES